MTPVAADALIIYLPSVVATPLERIGCSWLAVLLCLGFAVLALEPVRFIVRRRADPVVDPARWLLPGRRLAVVSLGLAVGAVGGCLVPPTLPRGCTG
jgi:hypothetical protein